MVEVARGLRYFLQVVNNHLDYLFLEEQDFLNLLRLNHLVIVD
tara:strand:- start:109 stop:237 length:129 start_codon:yes stop_codon:yes gene_type:complete